MENQTQAKDKVLLTVCEAADFFGIGQKKLRQMICENLDSGLFIQNGRKYLVKRKQFEQYLANITAI